MKLTVITPDKTLFEGDITSINIATSDGSFTILNQHAPLITVVKDAVSTILEKADKRSHIAFASGTVKVLNNEIALIVDYGSVGASKAEALTNLANLQAEIKRNRGDLGDDTILNLEMELRKRMKEMKR